MKQNRRTQMPKKKLVGKPTVESLYKFVGILDSNMRKQDERIEALKKSMDFAVVRLNNTIWDLNSTNMHDINERLKLAEAKIDSENLLGPDQVELSNKDRKSVV